MVRAIAARHAVIGCFSRAAIVQLFQLELHAAQLYAIILCILLCDDQVIFGILQLVGQGQRFVGRIACDAGGIENLVLLAGNLNHIASRAAVKLPSFRRAFQHAVGVRCAVLPRLARIVLVQPGKLFGPAFVTVGFFQLYAFIPRNLLPAVCNVRRFGALQLQVNGVGQVDLRNVRRTVLLFPLFFDRYVKQLTGGVDKCCRCSVRIVNGAVHLYTVRGNSAVFAAVEGHRFQACARLFIFPHNKPCADRDFVDHDLAVVLVTVFFHRAGVLFRRDYVAEALAADIAESDGKGKRLAFQCLAFGGNLAYNQLACLDLVVENHFQLGQLVIIGRIAVRAKNQRSARLFGLCVLVLGVVSVKGCINRLFRSAIVRGGAADVLQRANTARRNNVSLAAYICNRYAVFVYRPSCIVQFGVDLLLQGYVAAAAELVIKGNGLTVLQQELSVFIHNVAVAKVGGKHRKGRIFQLTAFGRAIVWDVVLRGGKACLFRQGRRTAECKVAQVNAARIVIAHRYAF